MVYGILKYTIKQRYREGFMRHIDTEHQQKIMQFIRMTGLNNFPDQDTPEEDFLTMTYRFSDIINAYDGCAVTAAENFIYAREKALAVASNITVGARDNIYVEVMEQLFYRRYIRYKWNQVKAYQQQTSVLSPALYQDYLAALDVRGYVDRTLPPCA